LLPPLARLFAMGGAVTKRACAFWQRRQRSRWRAMPWGGDLCAVAQESSGWIARVHRAISMACAGLKPSFGYATLRVATAAATCLRPPVRVLLCAFVIAADPCRGCRFSPPPLCHRGGPCSRRSQCQVSRRFCNECRSHPIRRALFANTGRLRSEAAMAGSARVVRLC